MNQTTWKIGAGFRPDRADAGKCARTFGPRTTPYRAPGKAIPAAHGTGHMEASFSNPEPSAPTVDASLPPNLAHAYEAMIEGWMHALGVHDEGSVNHSRRVADVAVRVGRSMGMSTCELSDLERGTLLHDIGKIGVPAEILNKPGPLDDAEWELMRRHPTYAHALLSPLEFLGAARDVPYCHHERWDGAGYPRGLSGEQIPLAARICAAVDIWDALSSDRPYRRALDVKHVREHLSFLAGNHLDPSVVERLLATVDESPAA